jgi:diaminopimelate decarboxylase
VIEVDSSHGPVLATRRVRELAQRFGTPLYIYDAERIRANAQQMRAVFPGTLHYFEFANRNHTLLQKIRELGFGISIARPAGVRRALQIGFTADQIQCSGFGFSDEDLCFFQAHGVSVNISNIGELDRMIKLFPQAKIGIRIDLGNDPWEKRGIPISDLLTFLEHRTPSIVGLHTYLGTNVLAPDQHSAVLQGLLAVLKQLPRTTRAGINYINLGGGFGYDYLNRRSFDWYAYAEGIRPLVYEVERTLGRPCDLKLEVGRALVANCGYLLVQVLDAFTKSGRRFIVVDSNASHFGRPARYGFHKSFYPFLEDGVHRSAWLPVNGEAAVMEGDIEVAVVGNSHYSKDWFGFIALPTFDAECLRGSYIVILDVGAYGEAMSDQWADEPRPAAVLVDGATDMVVCRREHPSELFDPVREREE